MFYSECTYCTTNTYTHKHREEQKEQFGAHVSHEFCFVLFLCFVAVKSGLNYAFILLFSILHSTTSGHTWTGRIFRLRHHQVL
jgi:hypothetical protein